MSGVNYPEFSSLELLDQYSRRYETENCVQLWKRDSRTIEKMKAVCPLKLKTYNPELKYYSIIYACKKGGRQFKSESSGLRQSSTYKDNCPMTIKLALTNDGTKLKIVHMVENHNHPVNRELFNNMPKQRKLQPEQKVEAITMLSMNCNQKLVQAYLQEKTGKPVQLKDLKNLRAGCKHSQSDIENVVKVLTQDDGIVQLAVNENGDMLGIYHQTPYMKNCFTAYPELMVLDATYKLNNLDMPLYVLMSINGNNEGEVIAVFLLSDETSDVIRHMVRVFKDLNPDWIKIKTFMTDKDFGEKTVLYDEFPEASHQLCLFHVLKRFRTAITAESMQITASQRKNVLEILQSIAFSKSEAQYDESYNRLTSLNIPKVTQYYEKNWHCIKHEWVECFKRKHTTYNIRTSNHLESFNQKIKQVCVKFSNLESFFENFAVVLNSVKLKRQQTVHDMLLKKKISCYDTDSPENFYLKLMTPFAFNLISKSLKKINDFDITTEDSTQFQVRDKENHENLHIVEIQESSAKCSCSSSVNTTLPCPHVFAAMSRMKMNILNKNLIPDRFLKSKYIDCYRIKDIAEDDVVTDNEQGSQSDVKMIKPKKRILSVPQKYKTAMSKCEKIASIISNFSMHDFKTHCDQLDNIINFWSQRKETVVAELFQTEHTECAECQVIITVHNEQEENNNVKHLARNNEETEKDDTKNYENAMKRTNEAQINNHTAEVLETEQIEYAEKQVIAIHNEQEEKENNIHLANPIEQKQDLEKAEEHAINKDHSYAKNIPINALIEAQTVNAVINQRLPVVRKRRGRPKGHDLTVVGLKRKKRTISK